MKRHLPTREPDEMYKNIAIWREVDHVVASMASKCGCFAIYAVDNEYPEFKEDAERQIHKAITNHPCSQS